MTLTHREATSDEHAVQQALLVQPPRPSAPLAETAMTELDPEQVDRALRKIRRRFRERWELLEV